METNSAALDDPQDLPLAWQRVFALLKRHGVAKHRRFAVLAEILGVNYHAVYRRLPAGAWSLEELQEIAGYFGESLAQLVDPADELATFVVGSVRLPCRVAVGGPTDPARPAGLVAVRGDREWLVMPVASEAIGARTHDVKSITIEPQPRESRVAVLDDEPDIAEGICSDLRDMGFFAEPFFSIESLTAALKTKRYDAYIIDWIIGRTSARNLIASIREADPRCPIAILTGQLEEGGTADEAELASVTVGENMQFYTKPLPVQIIGQRLKKTLGVQAASPSRGAR